MNNIRSQAQLVTNVIETSVALADFPLEAAEFKNAIGKNANPLKRMVARGLVTAAMKSPNAAAKLIGRPIPEGVTYAGAGFNSVVYRKQDEVIKVIKRSVFMNEVERSDLAQSENSRHAVLDAYMGNITVPQTVEIASHPIVRNARAVQIRQQFYDYDDIGHVFSMNRETLDTVGLGSVLHAHPSLDEALYTLADRGLAMAEETGMVPDINRRGNLGITTGEDPRLIIVDGQPINAGSDIVKGSTVRKLEQLQRFLDPIAA